MKTESYFVRSFIHFPIQIGYYEKPSGILKYKSKYENLDFSVNLYLSLFIQLKALESGEAYDCNWRDRYCFKDMKSGSRTDYRDIMVICQRPSNVSTTVNLPSDGSIYIRASGADVGHIEMYAFNGSILNKYYRCGDTKTYTYW